MEVQLWCNVAPSFVANPTDLAERVADTMLQGSCFSVANSFQERKIFVQLEGLWKPSFTMSLAFGIQLVASISLAF